VAYQMRPAGQISTLALVVTSVRGQVKLPLPGVSPLRSEASGCGHARHAGTADRTAPAIDGNAHRPAGAVRIPPLADPQGNDVTRGWPRRSFLELGALSSAVPCARLHTRELLWEWELTTLSDSAELLTSEIVTNAVQITQADARTASVRLWRTIA
jgi:hypothetical protein